MFQQKSGGIYSHFFKKSKSDSHNSNFVSLCRNFLLSESVPNTRRANVRIVTKEPWDRAGDILTLELERTIRVDEEGGDDPYATFDLAEADKVYNNRT